MLHCAITITAVGLERELEQRGREPDISYSKDLVDPSTSGTGFSGAKDTQESTALEWQITGE